MTARAFAAAAAAALADHAGDITAAAAALCRSIRPEDAPAALAVTLPAYLATLTPPSANTATTTKARPRTAAPTPRPSAKVASIRDAWTSRLDRTEYYVAGHRIALRDMTAAQLLEVASLNRDRAGELAASADRLERLADAMATHGAHTVADLPPDIGIAAWRTAA